MNMLEYCSFIILKIIRSHQTNDAYQIDTAVDGSKSSGEFGVVIETIVVYSKQTSTKSEYVFIQDAEIVCSSKLLANSIKCQIHEFCNFINAFYDLVIEGTTT